MKIAVYGGSFNPPHLGHYEAAKTVLEQLSPDRLLIIPTNLPPHKVLAQGSPTAEQRLELCKRSFAGLEGAEVCDMELRRQGKSYTADTVAQLMEDDPGAELYLSVGADMLESFEKWDRFEFLLANCTLAALPRGDEDMPLIEACARRLKDLYAAKVEIISHQPLPMSSGDVRERLPMRMGTELLTDGAYSYIIKNRLYGAKPELTWLREKTMEYLKPSRIAHVAGCEGEAVLLARRYGEDEDTAAEAGILHDITKRYQGGEQLLLCEKYGIICDNAERANTTLLHAPTGAALARELFGISDEVYGAIRWHTTGKPDMTRLEKIVYLADFIEPTRDFPGVDELRRTAYEDLDAGMRLALEMSLEDIRARNIEPYKDTVEAYIWYNTKEEEQC